MSKRSALIFAAIYLLPIILLLELANRFRGVVPISANSIPNNNIFYGILDKCSEKAYVTSSIDVANLDEQCKNGQLKSILNIKPSFSTRFVSKEFNTTININEEGFRLPNSGTKSDILVMGDSFTYGHGVEGEERFSWLLQSMCGRTVLNSSYMNGFQPEHYTHYFASNESLSPKIAIINLFVSNDFWSDIHETAVSASGSAIALPARSITHGGSLGGIAKTPKLNIIYQILLRLSRYSSLAENTRTSLLRKAMFGILPPNSPPPQKLVQNGYISHYELGRLARAINNLESIGKRRKKEFKLYVALIPDSLTDLNIGRMKKINSSMIHQLSKPINDSINLIDIAETLEVNDFYQWDKHYNPSGHSNHARALLKSLSLNSPGFCKYIPARSSRDF